MLFLVISHPAAARPSDVAADRRRFWDWLAPLEAAGTVRFCHPRVGRGAVALFDVDSTETLHGHLTVWAEMIPATFDVLPLVDVEYQKRLIEDGA
ncbi:MAG: DUF3303 family protein [Dehalococcoidia bacterium]